VALTEKIPLQEKIAQLENRIATLEVLVKKLWEDRQNVGQYVEVTYGSAFRPKVVDLNREVRTHWARGWKLFEDAFREFDEAFKGMFQR
jgi:hypothetical protein